jgi:outer membrane protein OmpA-like peptidoglycan-associated protein
MQAKRVHYAKASAATVFDALPSRHLKFSFPKGLTLGACFMRNEAMNQIRSIMLVLPIAAACFPASAETMRFEDATGILGTSCAKDIDSNCRGVNLDPARMKDCLARNQDSTSAQCKADYARAFDAIQKRVAARAAVRRICERDVAKLCGGLHKDDHSSALGCILAATRGISARCSQAVGEAGYRVPAPTAQAQADGARESWANELVGLESPPELDVAALRQQALERIKSRADAVPLKRPPVATLLLKLPKLIVEIQFDEDSPIVRPQSYRALGRIADTLSDPALLPYKFLIVGHAAATGKREYNLILSQRRADAVRDVLVNTFKISPKRLQAIGLGEEQLLDAAHPAAADNQRIQIVTVGKLL